MTSGAAIGGSAKWCSSAAAAAACGGFGRGVRFGGGLALARRPGPRGDRASAAAWASAPRPSLAQSARRSCGGLGGFGSGLRGRGGFAAAASLRGLGLRGRLGGCAAALRGLLRPAPRPRRRGRAARSRRARPARPGPAREAWKASKRASSAGAGACRKPAANWCSRRRISSATSLYRRASSGVTRRDCDTSSACSRRRASDDRSAWPTVAELPASECASATASSPTGRGSSSTHSASEVHRRRDCSSASFRKMLNRPRPMRSGPMTL